MERKYRRRYDPRRKAETSAKFDSGKRVGLNERLSFMYGHRPKKAPSGPSKEQRYRELEDFTDTHTPRKKPSVTRVTPDDGSRYKVPKIDSPILRGGGKKSKLSRPIMRIHRGKKPMVKKGTSPVKKSVSSPVQEAPSQQDYQIPKYLDPNSRAPAPPKSLTVPERSAEQLLGLDSIRSADSATRRQLVGPRKGGYKWHHDKKNVQLLGAGLGMVGTMAGMAGLAGGAAATLGSKLMKMPTKGPTRGRHTEAYPISIPKNGSVSAGPGPTRIGYSPKSSIGSSGPKRIGQGPTRPTRPTRPGPTKPKGKYTRKDMVKDIEGSTPNYNPGKGSGKTIIKPRESRLRINRRKLKELTGKARKQGEDIGKMKVPKLKRPRKGGLFRKR